MPPSRLVFRVHALRRMVQRRVSEHEVRSALESGDAIQEYPDDVPYPSRLVLGWVGTRPLHVVAAGDPQSGETIVITVYEPDLARWEPGFRRKRTT